MTSSCGPGNEHVPNSRLTRPKSRQLPNLSCADVAATPAAGLAGLDRNAVNRCCTMLGIRIADICEPESPFFGKVEADGSHFAARRVRGCRVRGGRGKAIVFGLPARGGKVHARIVPDVSRKALMQAVEARVDKGRDPVRRRLPLLRGPGGVGVAMPLRGPPRRRRVRPVRRAPQPHRRYRELPGLREEPARQVPGKPPRKTSAST